MTDVEWVMKKQIWLCCKGWEWKRELEGVNEKNSSVWKSLMNSLWWFSIIGNTITLLIVISIFRKDIKRSNIDEDYRKNSRFHRLLYYVAIACYMIDIFAVLFYLLRNIPYICIRAYTLAISFIFSLRASITLYQTCRLQYILSDTQIHSKRFGYPKWLFIVLYLIWILGVIDLWIFVWIMFYRKTTLLYNSDDLKLYFYVCLFAIICLFYVFAVLCPQNIK